MKCQLLCLKRRDWYLVGLGTDPTVWKGMAHRRLWVTAGLGGGQQRPELGQHAAPLTSRTTMGTYVRCSCLRFQAVT